MNWIGKGGIVMKTRSFFMLSLAVMAMSCAKEVLPENNPEENVELKLVPMEFTTALETKAGIVDGEGTVEWAANDQITVFDNLGGKNTFTTAVGGATSVFTGEVTEGATAFYALYPQRTSTASVLLDPENEVINSKLFPNQTAVLGSYAKGNGGAVMVAKADAENRLYFKNMTSHIRFTLAEDMTDVKSITLMGNNYEILAGTYKVDFSGAEPVLTVDKAETYVTLSNGDGPLAPGDYFFTILPVEFEAGFTVILSKTDGTQVAKKTTKEITSLGTRNKVLPMAALPSSEYKSHMNYFVKYNDGFDITFGGYTFNKSTHPGAVLVNNTYGNAKISADGVYFVSSDVESLATGYNACTNLLIMSAEYGVRVPFTFNNVLQPKTSATGYVVLSGLDINVNSKARLFEQAANSPFTEFGSIVLYDCVVDGIVANMTQFNEVPMVLHNLVVENCEYFIAGSNNGNSYILNTNNKESTINNVVIKNNVFQDVETTATLVNFKFVNSYNKAGATIGNISVIQNTLVKALTKNTGFVYAAAINGVCNVYDNFYIESHNPSTLTPIVNASGYGDSFTGTIEDNFFYVEGATKALSQGNNFPDNTIGGGRPRPLTTYPLSDLWNPINGIFGYKENLQYYNNIGDSTPYDSVPSNCGAQRKSIASPETANYAAANYVSVDYGTL